MPKNFDNYEISDDHKCPFCDNEIFYNETSKKWICSVCFAEASIIKLIGTKKNKNSNKPSWDELYFTICYLTAMRSSDPNTHFGSVIIDSDNVLVSTGYNSFPRNVESDKAGKRLSRENGEKYHWMEHAERNAIYNAARRGTMLKNCTLYITSTPCVDCARGIIQSGIKKVKIHEGGERFYKARYLNWNYDRTIDMFKEAGVEIEYVNCNIIIPVAYLNNELFEFSKENQL